MAEAPAGFDIRRILLLSGVSLVLVFAMLFFLFRGCVPAMRGHGGYTVVYSNLDLRDAANVIARLKELKIEYEIRDKGRSIAVNKDQADTARLGLAEKNLPAGGVVGWEIFDESKLGATDFDRRIQLIRALSGELSRTIRRIEAVEDARVQIVLPETRLFAVEVAPVTASVLLRLKPGMELSAEKITGIVHLVASSVENLLPQNITVVDDTGRILNSRQQLAAVEPLAPVAVIVPVSLEVSEVATQTALSVEEKVLMRVQAKKELETNLAGKAQEILNQFYSPNSTVIKVNIDERPGDKMEIQKLSAVVLVDNRVNLSAPLKASTYKAVAAAIGYNRQRGDTILVQKVPFHLATPAVPSPEVVKVEVEKPLPPKAPVEKRSAPWLAGLLLLVFIAGAITLVILLIARLFTRKASPTGSPRVEMPERRPVVPPPSPRPTTVDGIKAAAERNPERVAEMLRNWLTE